MWRPHQLGLGISTSGTKRVHMAFPCSMSAFEGVWAKIHPTVSGQAGVWRYERRRRADTWPMAGGRSCPSSISGTREGSVRIPKREPRTWGRTRCSYSSLQITALHIPCSCCCDSTASSFSPLFFFILPLSTGCSLLGTLALESIVSHTLQLPLCLAY